MARKKLAEPPDLGADGLQLWREIVEVYELSPAETETLRQAARTADIVAALDYSMWHSTAMIKGSQGQDKLNPLFAAVADQRRLLDGLIRSLNLPMPGEVEGKRRSPQQQQAAQTRWRAERERRAAERQAGAQ